MSLKSKIEAVIYASEEPVTLPQLAGLLGEEAHAELEALAARQAPLPLAVQDVDLDFPERNTMIDAVSKIGGFDERALTEKQSRAADGTAESTVPLDASDGNPEGSEQDAELAVTAEAEASASAASGIVTSEGAIEPEAAPDPRVVRERERRVRDHIRRAIDTLIRDYAESDRGIEIREVAGGFRMGTKPEYHDAVRGFVRSLKPTLKLTLQALETLAVVAYKQPVTAAEISEIRGVDSAGVLGGLMGRKLIATAGRKQVLGRPMLYKTTKEFLVRFGLKDVQELPSMEEFERLAGELNEQEDLPMEPTAIVIERANARGDADHIREVTGEGSTAEPSGANTASAPDGSADQAEDNSADTADENDTTTTTDSPSVAEPEPTPDAHPTSHES